MIPHPQLQAQEGVTRASWDVPSELLRKGETRKTEPQPAQCNRNSFTLGHMAIFSSSFVPDGDKDQI